MLIKPRILFSSTHQNMDRFWIIFINCCVQIYCLWVLDKSIRQTLTSSEQTSFSNPRWYAAISTTISRSRPGPSESAAAARQPVFFVLPWKLPKRNAEERVCRCRFLYAVGSHCYPGQSNHFLIFFRANAITLIWARGHLINSVQGTPQLALIWHSWCRRALGIRRLW